MNAKSFFENLKNHAWNIFQYFFETFKDLNINKYNFIILSAIVHHLSDDAFRKLIKDISSHVTKDARVYIMEPILPRRNLIKILFLFFLKRDFS